MTTEFEIGQMVYLKTDIYQHERIVTGVHIRELGVVYDLAFGVEYSEHFGFEISKEENTLKKVK